MKQSVITSKIGDDNRASYLSLSKNPLDKIFQVESSAEQGTLNSKLGILNKRVDTIKPTAIQMSKFQARPSIISNARSKFFIKQSGPQPYRSAMIRREKSSVDFSMQNFLDPWSPAIPALPKMKSTEQTVPGNTYSVNPP